jgi:ubiquinone/menaquinone biosynthesis C-methylase UbiE
MKLNTIERALMNNPVRGVVQRFYEGRLMQQIGGRLDGGRVLEAGCGQRAGMRVLLEQFGVSYVCGIDLDPRQVVRARRKLFPRYSQYASLAVASVGALPFPDSFFDAVFDFGVLHHVPLWQPALAELCRVLKPSGKFFFEEVTRAALNRWSYRTLFKHPIENRFSESEFVRELHSNRVEVLSSPRWVFLHDIFVGVGQRS